MVNLGDHLHPCLHSCGGDLGPGSTEGAWEADCGRAQAWEPWCHSDGSAVAYLRIGAAMYSCCKTEQNESICKPLDCSSPSPLRRKRRPRNCFLPHSFIHLTGLGGHGEPSLRPCLSSVKWCSLTSALEGTLAEKQEGNRHSHLTSAWGEGFLLYDQLGEKQSTEMLCGLIPGRSFTTRHSLESIHFVFLYFTNPPGRLTECE